MSSDLAVSMGELIALIGMMLFFICCLPRMAFAAGSGARPAPSVRASHVMIAPAETRARLLDRRNARNPLYRVMDLLVRATGKHRNSYPAALFFISLMVRLALLPWTIRQYRDSEKMRLLEPERRRLQEEHAKNPERLAEITAALYKEHKINPWAGILFAVVQGLVFIGLYNMVALYQYQFTHGGFFWIGSGLAHTYPGWIGANLAKPDLPLLAVYGLSMCFAPWLAVTANSSQGGVLKANAVLSAIFFTGWIWMRHTASAFVLYWLISNILALLTQVLMARWMKPGISGEAAES